MLNRHGIVAAICLLAGVVCGAAQGEDIKRVDIPNATIPISSAVTVPPGAAITFLAGSLADVADKDAPKGTPEAYGDTKTQTISILTKMKALLESQGLTLGDVVQIRVFLVGDPKLDGKMDFAGLNAGFGQFFGTADQPHKPVRTALQVVALPMPGGLIEIDGMAAKVPAKGKAAKH